jgi:rhamnosyl/mannosyltransferase
VRSERQVVIPNGIDSSTFSFVPPSAPLQGPWRLLYVGQLARQKGVYDLLDALALLNPDRKAEFELQIVYHVAGEERGIRAHAKRLGLTNVRFLGAKTPAELSRIYAHTHLLVMPSHREVLPAVITEAMLVGRPVVSTDVGAIREQLAGVGVIVRPRAPDELAQAIRSVVSDYPVHASCAAAASCSAQRRFSIDRMLNEHLALYQQVLEQAADQRLRVSHPPASSLGRLLAHRSRASSSR